MPRSTSGHVVGDRPPARREATKRGLPPGGGSEEEGGGNDCHDDEGYAATRCARKTPHCPYRTALSPEGPRMERGGTRHHSPPVLGMAQLSVRATLSQNGLSQNGYGPDP